MPFDADTKAKMFIKSARICCLCYKQCGTNIEAAHILDEHKGGPNDEENGIPVCFDCHQEVGGYDPKHPKGNKFSVAELKARRDKVYELVGTGFLQAQIILKRHRDGTEKFLELTSEEVKGHQHNPSNEANQILIDAIEGMSSLKSLPYKINLLSEQDQAFVLEQLVEQFQGKSVLESLLSVVNSAAFAGRSFLILEQLTRKVTLSPDLNNKARFAKDVPIDLFKTINSALKTTFFIELIDIMERDRWSEVNLIAYPTVRLQSALPEELQERYVLALLNTAKSGAFNGKPAARHGLLELPPEMIAIGINVFTPKYMCWHNDEFYKQFVLKYKKQWPSNEIQLFDDFVALDSDAFNFKYRQRTKNE